MVLATNQGILNSNTPRAFPHDTRMLTSNLLGRAFLLLIQVPP